MSRQKGILPFFRLSRFGGLMHFSYFCLIKNVIHENSLKHVASNHFFSKTIPSISGIHELHPIVGGSYAKTEDAKRSKAIDI